jgi:hypothetical protein
MTIFWDRTGALITFENGCLHIEDLNAEIKITWRMARWEMCKAGLRFILAALRP